MTKDTDLNRSVKHGRGPGRNRPSLSFWALLLFLGPKSPVNPASQVGPSQKYKKANFFFFLFFFPVDITNLDKYTLRNFSLFWRECLQIRHSPGSWTKLSKAHDGKATSPSSTERGIVPAVPGTAFLLLPWSPEKPCCYCKKTLASSDMKSSKLVVHFHRCNVFLEKLIKIMLVSPN